jgi:cytidine deaminase
MSKLDQELTASYTQLVEAARAAAKNAYAPYSHKPQGAAVLTEDGQIICGVTVELASYSYSISAEINAVTQAVALGHRHFKAIAIEPYSNPSGPARQFIAEFGINVDLVRGTDSGVQVISLKELLPYHFGPDNIETGKVIRDATSGSVS